MSLVLAVLLQAAVSQAAEASPWPLAERAIMKRCPNAESEEIVTCASELIEIVDQRIKRDLFRTQRRTCKARYSKFARQRQVRIHRKIDREGSVVSQLSAMWNALEQTLRFERSLKTRR
jgi:hypothetical protein